MQLRAEQPPPFAGRPSTECPEPLPGAQFYAPPVPGADKTVALTFDDGPGPSTQAVLDILERFHVRATFMNIGEEEEERPSLVAEEVADGFVVGDHTMTHPDLETVTASDQAQEVDGVVHLDRGLVDTSPCVFRPPYGDYDAGIVSLVNSRRMTLWMWSVDTDDWMAEGSGSSYWVQRIVSTAEAEGGALDHPVVLMHNQAISMPATVAALPSVIEFFRSHGYVFVDLLGRTGPPGSCGTGGNPRVAGVALRSGASLASGASLSSLNGEFRLAMRADGDLEVVLGAHEVLWRSRTAGHRGAHLVVREDGDLQVVTPGGAVVFSSGTSGHLGARLVLGTDGALAVEAGGSTLWSDHADASVLTGGSRLEEGWELASPDGKCRLVQQSSGELSLLDAHGQVLWRATGTPSPGAVSVLTLHGDLELRAARSVLWASDTATSARPRLAVLDTGRITIAGPHGAARWMTP